MKNRSLLLFAATCMLGGSAHAAAASILRITEVMSQGDVPDWFELTNFGDTAADLTNYRVDDSSFTISTSLALGGIISVAPGESVVFTEGSTANPNSNIAAFRTNWSLGAATQVGGYGGLGIGLAAAGDGVTLFTDTAANFGTELTGPFGGLIRISFGVATAGTSFNWTYDATGASTSPATGQLTTAGTTWLNGATTVLGTPGTVPEPASFLLGGLGVLGLLRRRRA